MCSRPSKKSLDNRTQKELVTLLGKMVRAALTSSPLYEIEFFADYLDAELNRRTLYQLQKFGESDCDSKSSETEEQNNFPSLSKGKDMQKSRYRDGCVSKYRSKQDSRCIGVQTDKNHLQYQTKSPFLQKMEAELISSVIENLNNTNHECLCNCAPPPLFWYHITRPQVVGSCRKSKVKLTKRTLQESAAKTSEGSDTVEEVLMINASPDTGHEKMTGYNDAGLAKIIDREMKSTTEMKTSERPVNPPPTEISFKVDASTQVETIVLKAKKKPPQKQIPPEVEVSHKYVQTMDLDISAPETVAQYEHPDKPCAAAPVDEPTIAPVAETVECEVVAAVDWSQFTQVPIVCHSSTDWLNIEIDGRGEPDYDTEWSELTNYQAIDSVFTCESVFNWLSADICIGSGQAVSEADKCVKPLDDDFDLASAQPPEDFHDYHDDDVCPPKEFHDYCDDDVSVYPPKDFYDFYDGDDLDIASVYSGADWTDGDTISRMSPDSPAQMMTPDMEDVLIACEEPALLLDADVVDELLVLQWNPVDVAPYTGDAESYHIPTPVPQCSEILKENEEEKLNLCAVEDDQNRTENDQSTEMLKEDLVSSLIYCVYSGTAENDQNRTEKYQTTEMLKEDSASSLAHVNLGSAEKDQKITENYQSTEMLKEDSVSSLTRVNLDSAENDQNRTENASEMLQEVPPPSFSNAKLCPAENAQNRTAAANSPENEMLKQVFGDDLLTSSGHELEKIGKTYNRGKNPNILRGNKEHWSDEESTEHVINSEEINEHLKSASKELTNVSTTAENSEAKDSKQNISALNTNQSIHRDESEKPV